MARAMPRPPAPMALAMPAMPGGTGGFCFGHAAWEPGRRPGLAMARRGRPWPQVGELAVGARPWDLGRRGN